LVVEVRLMEGGWSFEEIRNLPPTVKLAADKKEVGRGTKYIRHSNYALLGLWGRLYHQSNDEVL